MPTRRVLELTAPQRADLTCIRDTHPKPYVRERAAAILKVAEGTPGAAVAARGLLRRRKPDTVYHWLNRFREQGVAGLTIRSGRGRKPAFSPSASRCLCGQGGVASPGPP